MSITYYNQTEFTKKDNKDNDDNAIGSNIFITVGRTTMRRAFGVTGYHTYLHAFAQEVNGYGKTKNFTLAAVGTGTSSGDYESLRHTAYYDLRVVPETVMKPLLKQKDGGTTKVVVNRGKKRGTNYHNSMPISYEDYEKTFLVEIRRRQLKLSHEHEVNKGPGLVFVYNYDEKNFKINLENDAQSPRYYCYKGKKGYRVKYVENGKVKDVPISKEGEATIRGAYGRFKPEPTKEEEKKNQNLENTMVNVSKDPSDEVVESFKIIGKRVGLDDKEINKRNAARTAWIKASDGLFPFYVGDVIEDNGEQKIIFRNLESPLDSSDINVKFLREKRINVVENGAKELLKNKKKERFIQKDNCQNTALKMVKKTPAGKDYFGDIKPLSFLFNLIPSSTFDSNVGFSNRNNASYGGWEDPFVIGLPPLKKPSNPTNQKFNKQKEPLDKFYDSMQKLYHLKDKLARRDDPTGDNTNNNNCKTLKILKLGEAPPEELEDGVVYLVGRENPYKKNYPDYFVLSREVQKLNKTRLDRQDKPLNDINTSELNEDKNKKGSKDKAAKIDLGAPVVTSEAIHIITRLSLMQGHKKMMEQCTSLEIVSNYNFLPEQGKFDKDKIYFTKKSILNKNSGLIENRYFLCFDQGHGKELCKDKEMIAFFEKTITERKEVRKNSNVTDLRELLKKIKLSEAYKFLVSEDGAECEHLELIPDVTLVPKKEAMKKNTLYFFAQRNDSGDGTDYHLACLNKKGDCAEINLDHTKDKKFIDDFIKILNPGKAVEMPNFLNNFYEKETSMEEKKLLEIFKNKNGELGISKSINVGFSSTKEKKHVVKEEVKNLIGQDSLNVKRDTIVGQLGLRLQNIYEKCLTEFNNEFVEEEKESKSHEKKQQQQNQNSQNNVNLSNDGNNLNKNINKKEEIIDKNVKKDNQLEIIDLKENKKTIDTLNHLSLAQKKKLRSYEASLKYYEEALREIKKWENEHVYPHESNKDIMNASGVEMHLFFRVYLSLRNSKILNMLFGPPVISTAANDTIQSIKNDFVEQITHCKKHITHLKNTQNGYFSRVWQDIKLKLNDAAARLQRKFLLGKNNVTANKRKVNALNKLIVQLYQLEEKEKDTLKPSMLYDTITKWERSPHDEDNKTLNGTIIKQNTGTGLGSSTTGILIDEIKEDLLTAEIKCEEKPVHIEPENLELDDVSGGLRNPNQLNMMMKN